jgi:hypothetical protein
MKRIHLTVILLAALPWLASPALAGGSFGISFGYHGRQGIGFSIYDAYYDPYYCPPVFRPDDAYCVPGCAIGHAHHFAPWYAFGYRDVWYPPYQNAVAPDGYVYPSYDAYSYPGYYTSAYPSYDAYSYPGYYTSTYPNDYAYYEGYGYPYYGSYIGYGAGWYPYYPRYGRYPFYHRDDGHRDRWDRNRGDRDRGDHNRWDRNRDRGGDRNGVREDHRASGDQHRIFDGRYPFADRDRGQLGLGRGYDSSRPVRFDRSQTRGGDGGRFLPPTGGGRAPGMNWGTDRSGFGRSWPGMNRSISPSPARSGASPGSSSRFSGPARATSFGGHSSSPSPARSGASPGSSSRSSGPARAASFGGGHGGR